MGIPPPWIRSCNRASPTTPSTTNAEIWQDTSASGRTRRSPAGRRLGLYEVEPALDVGLGMRPDLTGRGLGEEFVHAGLRFARETYSPPAFRLTVATFNQRAIRVYERAGFETVETFGAPTQRHRKGMAADEMREV